MEDSSDFNRRTYQNRILLERFWCEVKGRDRSTRLSILRGYARHELEPDPYVAHKIKRLRSDYRKKRARGFAEALGACWLCSRRADHRHHILPLSNGGRNVKKNIVPLCVLCHRAVHAQSQVLQDRATNDGLAV